MIADFIQGIHEPVFSCSPIKVRTGKVSRIFFVCDLLCIWDLKQQKISRRLGIGFGLNQYKSRICKHIKKQVEIGFIKRRIQSLFWAFIFIQQKKVWQFKIFWCRIDIFHAEMTIYLVYLSTFGFFHAPSFHQTN